jgi:hypothetical protein
LRLGARLLILFLASEMSLALSSELRRMDAGVSILESGDVSFSFLLPV